MCKVKNTLISPYMYIIHIYKGNKSERIKILNNFIISYSKYTSIELDLKLGNASFLFLGL